MWGGKHFFEPAGPLHTPEDPMASGSSEALVQVAIHPAGGETLAVTVVQGEVKPGPEAVDSGEFSHGYTGKHDHGELPAQDTNAYTAVLRALQVRLQPGVDAHTQVPLLPYMMHSTPRIRRMHTCSGCRARRRQQMRRSSR